MAKKTAVERTQRNIEREEIVKHAFDSAKEIIVAGCDGSEEERDYLFGLLAKSLNDQLCTNLKYQMLRYDLVGHIVSE